MPLCCSIYSSHLQTVINRYTFHLNLLRHEKYSRFFLLLFKHFSLLFCLGGKGGGDGDGDGGGGDCGDGGGGGDSSGDGDGGGNGGNGAGGGGCGGGGDNDDDGGGGGDDGVTLS